MKQLKNFNKMSLPNQNPPNSDNYDSVIVGRGYGSMTPEYADDWLSWFLQNNNVNAIDGSRITNLNELKTKLRSPSNAR